LAIEFPREESPRGPSFDRLRTGFGEGRESQTLSTPPSKG